MNIILTVTRFLGQSICLFLFTLLSAFVFTYGKKNTGIIRDYVITSIILGLLIWRMC